MSTTFSWSVCERERACSLPIILNYKSINLVDNWSPWLVNNSDWCWNVDPLTVHTGTPFSHTGRRYLYNFPCLNVFIQHAPFLAHGQVLLEALKLTSHTANCFVFLRSSVLSWSLSAARLHTWNPTSIPSPAQSTSGAPLPENHLWEGLGACIPYSEREIRSNFDAFLCSGS